MAPLSITRNGNNITLSGDFSDDSAKAALMKALEGSLPADVNIIDQIHINPDVDALDFSNAGPIFKDGASITDFNLTVNGDIVTLAGTAASQGQKNKVGNEAKHTWSNLNVVDNLAVNGPVPPPAPPGPPAPAASGGTDLQSAINATTGGPITGESSMDFVLRWLWYLLAFVAGSAVAWVIARLVNRSSDEDIVADVVSPRIGAGR